MRSKGGFPEVIYQRALAYEFDLQGIVAERECELPVFYWFDPLKTGQNFRDLGGVLNYIVSLVCK